MKGYFTGKESLWKAFWLFTVGGILAIAIFGYGIYLVGLVMRIPTTQIAIITIMITLIPYIILCLIVVWRNSPNTTRNGWSILARTGVILIIGSYVIGMFQL